MPRYRKKICREDIMKNINIVSDDHISNVILKRIAREVNTARHLKGLSVDDLSVLSGISERQIYFIEEGTRKIGIESFIKLAQVLDLDAEKTIFGNRKLELRDLYHDIETLQSKEIEQVKLVVKDLANKKYKEKMGWLLYG